MVKNLPAMQETWVQSLGQEDPLEKGKTTQSSILAWRIPWTEEPGGLDHIGSQRVRQDWDNLACSTSLSYSWAEWEGKLLIRIPCKSFTVCGYNSLQGNGEIKYLEFSLCGLVWQILLLSKSFCWYCECQVSGTSRQNFGQIWTLSRSFSWICQKFLKWELLVSRNLNKTYSALSS